MAVKSTGQLSLVEAFLGSGLARPSRLERLAGLVKWYRFEKLLKRLSDDGPGRPAYPPLVMFKALLLQSLYGLSDGEAPRDPDEGFPKRQGKSGAPYGYKAHVAVDEG